MYITFIGGKILSKEQEGDNSNARTAPGITGAEADERARVGASSSWRLAWGD